MIILGCNPSEIYLSACFKSSPTRRTTEVVPSPQISSCAVAARAIITAVGFCICISRNRTFPSFVSFICESIIRGVFSRYQEGFHTAPAPSTNLLKILVYFWLIRETETNILMVPIGPKFDFKTSCKPSPALILTFRASPLLCSKSVAASQISTGKIILSTPPLGSKVVRQTF